MNPAMTRARFLRMLAAIGIGVGSVPYLPSFASSDDAPRTAESDAVAFVGSSLLIDGMVWPRAKRTMTWAKTPGEVKKLSGIDAGFWQVDVGTLSNLNDTVEFHGEAVVRIDDVATLEQARESRRLGLIYFAARHWFLGGSVERLSAWHAQGLRAFQIAYDGENELGGGFDHDDTRLTPFGKQVVAELNRLGIVIDVSQSGRRTTLDVAAAASRPILATRGNAEKLSSHGRNKSDKELKAIARTGGVVGVANISRYLRSSESHQPGIQDYAEHVDHLVELLGIDHVGLSSESWLDGEPRYIYDRTDDLLNSYKRWFHVTDRLMGLGYRDDDLRKLLGRNYLRALRENWG